jgi:ribosome recycling factor
MDLNALYSDTKEHMGKSLDALKKDFLKLRTGKVNINILDSVQIDYYGTMTPLNQVGSVLAPDATTITVTPWEKHLLKDIEKAIQEANLGVNPNNDGECIKLFFPPMTVEQRQESVKQSKGFGEKAKVAVRNIRRDSNDKIKKLEKDKEISEDESKGAQNEIQKITDEMVKLIDNTLKEKEQEILKI